MVQSTETSRAGKVSYSQFACIGSGFAAIGLGAQLKRWYGIENVQFFERHHRLGGTWFINQYPGKPWPFFVRAYIRTFTQVLV